MSEPENFIARWSRRKRAAADAAAPAEKATAPVPDEAPAPARAADQPNDGLAELPFDLDSLPSIESIGADSDVRAFLQPGVPPDLTRAALRRAWSTDPAIRDFVGLVENGWDFNDPEGIPGFGRIDPTEVAQLLTQAIGALPAETSTPAPEPVSSAAQEAGSESFSTGCEPQSPSSQDQPASDARNNIDVQCNGDDAASQDKSQS